MKSKIQTRILQRLLTIVHDALTVCSNSIKHQVPDFDISGNNIDDDINEGYNNV